MKEGTTVALRFEMLGQMDHTIPSSVQDHRGEVDIDRKGYPEKKARGDPLSC